MKKMLRIILSVCILAGLLAGTDVFAASRRETIQVGLNQAWNTRANIARSGAYGAVFARAYSVYPTGGGTDNFRYVQTQVTTTGGTAISDVVTLDEQRTSNQTITLYAGTLTNMTIRFRFRGNNAGYAAYADVSYDGR